MHKHARNPRGRKACPPAALAGNPVASFSRRPVLARRGKGGLDRATVIPEAARGALRAHLGRVKTLHERDLAQGRGRVDLPDGLATKYAERGPCPGRGNGYFPPAAPTGTRPAAWSGGTICTRR